MNEIPARCHMYRVWKQFIKKMSREKSQSLYTAVSNISAKQLYVHLQGRVVNTMNKVAIIQFGKIQFEKIQLWKIQFGTSCLHTPREVSRPPNTPGSFYLITLNKATVAMQCIGLIWVGFRDAYASKNKKGKSESTFQAMSTNWFTWNFPPCINLMCCFSPVYIHDVFLIYLGIICCSSSYTKFTIMFVIIIIIIIRQQSHFLTNKDTLKHMDK